VWNIVPHWIVLRGTFLERAEVAATSSGFVGCALFLLRMDLQKILMTYDSFFASDGITKMGTNIPAAPCECAE
jgi:hypothetical protein